MVHQPAIQLNMVTVLYQQCFSVVRGFAGIWYLGGKTNLQNLEIFFLTYLISFINDTCLCSQEQVTSIREVEMFSLQEQPATRHSEGE